MSKEIEAALAGKKSIWTGVHNQMTVDELLSDFFSNITRTTKRFDSGFNEVTKLTRNIELPPTSLMPFGGYELASGDLSLSVMRLPDGNYLILDEKEDKSVIDSALSTTKGLFSEYADFLKSQQDAQEDTDSSLDFLVEDTTNHATLDSLVTDSTKHTTVEDLLPEEDK